jgi:hypothetical protein
MNIVAEVNELFMNAERIKWIEESIIRLEYYLKVSKGIIGLLHLELKSTTLNEHKMNCKTLDMKDIKPLLLRVNQGLM